MAQDIFMTLSQIVLSTLEMSQNAVITWVKYDKSTDNDVTYIAQVWSEMLSSARQTINLHQDLISYSSAVTVL